MMKDGSRHLKHILASITRTLLCSIPTVLGIEHDADAALFVPLGRNSGVMNKKKMAIHEVGKDSFAMGVEVWEVMDAGLNYIAVEFMVRQYSYTGPAMIGCLHECRYFCGVVSSP